jgi:general secretion pathway protein I
VGDADFTCDQLGLTYRGKLVIRPTPNPNFRRIDVQVATDDGSPILSLSTILGRY